MQGVPYREHIIQVLQHRINRPPQSDVIKHGQKRLRLGFASVETVQAFFKYRPNTIIER